MILTLLLTLLLSLPEPVFHELFQSDQLIISYSKTRCMGKCPAFQFEVYEDGTAIYTGEDFVDRLGKWSTTLSDKDLKKLKAIFEDHDFFAFEERYYEEVSDLPTTYLYYKSDTQEKKVMDYYGAPQELKYLELEIEAYIESLDWERLKVK